MAYENLFSGRLVLFNNSEKKSEKSPDMSGTVEFTLEGAMALTEWITAQKGEENYAGDIVIKIPVSAWHRESKKGTGFISGQISVAKPVAEELPF